MEATGSSGSMADNDNTEMMELASRRLNTVLSLSLEAFTQTFLLIEGDTWE